MKSVCLCVCVCEGERERERGGREKEGRSSCLRGKECA